MVNFTFTLEGKIYKIPINAVAQNKVNHFANSGDYEVGTEPYNIEYDALMEDRFLAYDWIVNNTFPEDFAESLTPQGLTKKKLNTLLWRDINVDIEAS